MYGGVPGGEPVDPEEYDEYNEYDPDAKNEDIRITDISDLINDDDDPPFVTDDE
jgi:hypothetical protein